MKRSFIFGYDYGTGGLYALISANSEQEVLKKYPFLKLVTEEPPGGKAAYFKYLFDKGPFDIDDEPPKWIKMLQDEHDP